MGDVGQRDRRMRRLGVVAGALAATALVAALTTFARWDIRRSDDDCEGGDR